MAAFGFSTNSASQSADSKRTTTTPHAVLSTSFKRLLSTDSAALTTVGVSYIYQAGRTLGVSLQNLSAGVLGPGTGKKRKMSSSVDEAPVKRSKNMDMPTMMDTDVVFDVSTVVPECTAPRLSQSVWWTDYQARPAAA